MRTASILAGAATAALMLLTVLSLAGRAGAEGPKIFGTVGPGFTITLADAQGNKISRLDPGAYELVVDDTSDVHNFRLTGPGVSVATEVEFVGQRTFPITVSDGKYTYVCDPHAGDMFGSFSVGSEGSAGGGSAYGSSGGGSSGGGGGPGAARAKTPSGPVGSTLAVTSGPGFTITLETTAGRPVRTLRPGSYTFLLRDRARAHNAHLRGAGVNRATTVPFVGTRTVRLTLRKGTLTYLCDPHAAGGMKGTVTVG